jgi:hypothetical protein
MAVLIGHASINENGTVTGGTQGDQTGKEVCTRNWYNAGWTVLLRPTSSSVAEKMAKACEAGCANNKIGYDQSKRNTLRTQAQSAGWDLSKITTACSTDCSAFMTVCAEAAGVDVSKCYTSGNAPTTWTMRTTFSGTGAFTVLTDSKYLTSEQYLQRGDVLVKESSHTAMVLSNGSSAGGTTSATASTVATTQAANTVANGTGASTSPTPASFRDMQYKGIYTVKASGGLNIRQNAGTQYTSYGLLSNGSTVQCWGYYNKSDNSIWLYVVGSGKTGYVSMAYLQKQ